ncbi:MAG TPA: GNAT family protein [Candidatus Paceibacterota bacterium]
MPARVIFREGSRVYLRPRIESDIPCLFKWSNDPDILKYLSYQYPRSEAEIRQSILDSGKQLNRFAFIIMLKGETPEHDRPIGWMSLFDIDRDNGTAVTGAAIGEQDCQCRGYGTEAKMLLLDFAFNTINLRKVYSHVYAANKRSLRYSEKCGYRHEATLPKHKYLGGRLINEHILAVYADRWRKLWQKSKKSTRP